MQGSMEASLCKYGLYLLRAALPPAAQKAPPWATFLVLYKLLDEYALHLIQVLLKLPLPCRGSHTRCSHTTCALAALLACLIQCSSASPLQQGCRGPSMLSKVRSVFGPCYLPEQGSPLSDAALCSKRG